MVEDFKERTIPIIKNEVQQLTMVSVDRMVSMMNMHDEIRLRFKFDDEEQIR